jgi:hypothetical protein
MFNSLGLPTKGILPESVRYALKFQGARLGLPEIVALAKSGFENEALYFFIKAAAHDTDLQCLLLQRLTLAVGSLDDDGIGDDSAGAIRTFIESNAGLIPAGTQVNGAKIAQLSRQGFGHWHRLLRKMAHQCASSDRGTYIVGHAMFVGLPAFIQIHRQAKKRLRILIPDLALDPASSICGYEINGSTAKLSKSFDRDHEAIIVDDTCHTGACHGKVDRFWRNGNPQAPSYEFVVMDQA